jgi:ORF6N domain
MPPKKHQPVLAPIDSSPISIGQVVVVARGQRVLLDSDLATLYGTTTKRLNQQVKRNSERFPAEFMFRLTSAETQALNRSQFATGLQRHRNPRYPPFAFTEHGAVMAATVLNSPQAIEMSLLVVRTFVQLRSMARANVELGRQIAQLERRVGTHDVELARIVEAIKALTVAPGTRKPGIGFLADIS